VVAPEPTSTGRRGPELKNTWHRRSSTQQGDETQGHGTRGSTTPGSTYAGRYGPKLQFAWQRVDACPAPCLDLEFVCGVPGLQGADRDEFLPTTNNHPRVACGFFILIFFNQYLRNKLDQNFFLNLIPCYEL
jgi:hypothetical protein